MTISRVVAVGDNSYGQLNVIGWNNIIQVAAGGFHTVGLRSDGSVVAVGWNNYGQLNVNGWSDIVQVAAGAYHTLGLKSDGRVVGVGNNEHGQLEVSNWDLYGTPAYYGIFVGADYVLDNLKADISAIEVYNKFSNLNNVVYRKLIIDDYTVPTEWRIKWSIDDVKKSIKPGDILFIYIVGHGFGEKIGWDETTLTGGDEFVVLNEFGYPFPIDRGRLTDDELTSMLQGLDHVQKWVIIDACNSGGFWGNQNPDDEGDLEKLSNIGMFASASETEPGKYLRDPDFPVSEDPFRDDPDFMKPIFSIAIREALTKKSNGNVRADDDSNGAGDGILTFYELTSWVKQDTKFTLEQLYGLNLEGAVVATNDFGDPVVFSWNEWNPESQNSDDFYGTLITKSPDSVNAKSNGPYSTTVGQVFALDASGSYSPNGNIVRFEWDIDNDGIYELSTDSPTMNFSYNEPYDGTLNLRVTDNQGFSDMNSASIYISSSFVGDFNNDCDVDGFDLSMLIGNYTISIDVFANNYGRSNCQILNDLLPPTLFYPFTGIVVDNGCSDLSSPIEWNFYWTPAAGASKYHIYVNGPDAVPIIDQVITSADNYHFIEHSYIEDANRTNWSWRMRSGNDEGQWSEWSESNYFDVEPLNTDCP